MSQLKRLTRRKYYGALIAAVAIASLVTGIAVGHAAKQNMTAALYDRSSYEPGIMALSWRRGIDGCSMLARSVQPAYCLRDVLSQPNDDALVSMSSCSRCRASWCSQV
jgi:hypothetical protein